MVALASPDDYDEFNPAFTGRYLTENPNWHFINAFAADLKSRGIELITYAFSSSGQPGLYSIGHGGNLVRLIKPSKLALRLIRRGGVWRYFGSLLNSYRLVKPLLQDNPTTVLNTHFPHFPRGEALSVLVKIMGKRFGYFQSITLPDSSIYDFVARIFQHVTDFYVFTDKESSLEAMKRYDIPPHKTHVVGLLPHMRADGSAQHSKKPQQKTILYVGRLDDKQKAVSTLIKAFRLVVENEPNTELRIVGEGFDRPALEALAKELGVTDKTHFLGWLDGERLSEAYRSAYLFCLPSRYESYALVVTEAMLAGLPVVCTDLPALRDRVENGTTALTFQSDNVEDLASKLLLLLENEDYALQISRNGKQKAQQIVNKANESITKTLEQLVKASF